MIATNELDRNVEFYEIKRNRKNIDLSVLEEKSKTMLNAVHIFKGYSIETKGLDMQDM